MMLMMMMTMLVLLCVLVLLLVLTRSPFSSDNGGPADHANNWPLRGSKGTDFEGGTRVCAFLNGGALSPSLRGKKVLGMMHVTDWWATLSLLVGQDTSDAKVQRGPCYS